MAAGSPPRLARLRFEHALAAVLLLDLVFGVAVHAGMGDPDFWWHLRTGRWILAMHRVPMADLYSFTAAGKPWVAHEWGFEVLLYSVYRLGGFLGVAFLKATILTATFAVVLRLCRRIAPDVPVAAILATAVAAGLSMVHWTERPHLITYFLLAFWMDRIYAFREGDERALRWLPLTMAVWVNVHAGYLIGGLVATTFVLAEAGNGWLRCLPGGGWSPSQRNTIWRTAGLCLLASLLNPHGARLLLYPLQYRSGGGLTRYVMEWMSPDFHRPLIGLVLAPTILACIILPIFSRRQPGAGELSLVLLGLRLALQSIRHLPVFGILVAPFLASQLAALAPVWKPEPPASDGALVELPAATASSTVAGPPADPATGPADLSLAAGNQGPAPAQPGARDQRFRAVPTDPAPSVALEPSAANGSPEPPPVPQEERPWVPALFIAAAIAIALVLAPWRRPAKKWVDPKDFPVRATAVLLRLPGPRRLLNDYGWGGYLIWTAWPQERVFIDGRADVYGGALMKQYHHLAVLRPDWRTILRRYRVDTVLWRSDAPLSQALALLPNWRCAFKGDGSVLFVKRDRRTGG